jgi:hypothetical protein
MYLKQICDEIGNAVNDMTLKSTGVNYARTKSWVQQFYFLDLVPRVDWTFTNKQDTFTTTSGTQRYNLPRWIDNPTRIQNIIHPTSYEALTQSILADVTGKYDLTIYGTPTQYVIGPRVRTTYTTGTITGTSALKVITGSGTSWTTSNIAQFDYIQIGSYAYTVNSVDSNTQITVFEDLAASFAASTYTAVLDRWTVDLYPVPSSTLAMIIHGKQIVPRLDDDYDIPILPDNWHYILVKAGIVKALQHNQEDYSGEFQELELAIKRLVSEDQSEADRLEGLAIPRSRSY